VLDKEVFRTEMFKLTYLLDDLSYQHDGVTLTGLDYLWYHYGPNAVDDGVKKRLDSLTKRRLARYRETLVPPDYRGLRLPDRGSS
jgi:hypothetical protein